MMEHIRQHDWFISNPDENFMDENDLDNCVIERIMRNKFRDPMITSDSDDDNALVTPKIDWGQVFKKGNGDMAGRRKAGYVPGCRAVPPYPKLSSLDVQQQFQCLKVLCAQNPKILPMEFLPRPMNRDYKAFESLKETYLKEQQEYIEWAKSLWASSHSQRALRPKPITENVYEAEFKMRANSLQSFPKFFEMAAHISLTNKFNSCDMNFKQDLVKVNLAKLPKVDPEKQLSELNINRVTILSQSPLPQPCNKHPCWFTLPKEQEMSVLPLTEIHRELSQLAVEHGARVVAGGGALRCLALLDEDWCLPLSVCQIQTLDGDKKNILVFGSEFSTRKKSAMTRTYRAYRHLLENALIPPRQQENGGNKENVDKSRPNRVSKKKQPASCADDDSSDEDLGDDAWFGNLIIDEDKSEENVGSDQAYSNKTNTNNNEDKVLPNNTRANKKQPNEQQQPETNNRTSNSNKNKTQEEKTDGFYTCSCAGTIFENPPLRSFRKWEVKNKVTNDKFNMIVHCSHKMKGPNGLELISEPLVEYQIDLGGSAQTEQKIKSLALSLFLRRNASLLNVRIESGSGEIVTMDTLGFDDLKKIQPNAIQDVANVLYETVTQLQSLLPGHYILKHERAHGSNALLYATRRRGDGDELHLEFDCSILAEDNEAKSVKTPPVLTDVLLPVHKLRRILPLAFTPFERFVAKEPKKPPARAKVPPQALQWPKKKKRKNKKNK